MGIQKRKQFFLLLAHRLIRKNKHSSILLGSIVFSWILICISLIAAFSTNLKKEKNILGVNLSALKKIAKSDLLNPSVVITIPTSTPTPSQTPTPTSTPTPTLIPTKIPTPTIKVLNSAQYTAQKINDFTFKVSNLSNDSSMASPNDIFNALNSYRQNRGVSSLSWDTGLATYAQDRANLFSSKNELDGHAGFNDFMKNDGFSKVGFNSLGENSAYLSGPMNGEKIVSSIFGADSLHDGNQLDNWTHVGIGVNGNAVNVNFGKNKK